MKLAYPPEYTKNRVAAYPPEYTKNRIALIVVSWHAGWEEVATKRGNGREIFTRAKNGVFALNDAKNGPNRA